MTYSASTQTVQQERQKIIALLEQLPADSLPMVETFIRFMQTQPPTTPATIKEPTPWLYPTVPASPKTLDNWVGVLEEGYEGDALADTESLYDEA